MKKIPFTQIILQSHILLIAMPYYGFVPVIYPHYSCTLTFGNSPLIISRAHDG